MKKIFISLTLLFAFIFTPAFAAYPNTCLQHIDEHFPFGNTSLVLDRCSLESSDMPQLMKYVMSHQEITSIWLQYNKLGKEDAALLATIPKLEELNLDGNSIETDGAIALAHAQIKFLHINRNSMDIDAEGISALAKNPTIEQLDISGGGEYGSTFTSIEADQALAKNTTLKELFFNDAFVSDKDVTLLATNKSIWRLELAGNNIGPDGAAMLAKNSTITDLNIIKNHIGDKGAIALANDPNLTELHLTQNDLGDDAAIALAKHPKLTTLTLSYNHITDKGAFALANNKVLTVLIINSNHIGPKGIAALHSIPQLQILETEGNDGSTAQSTNKAAVDFAKTYCSKKHVPEVCDKYLKK